ncbi:epimerase [soil metagenome]
MADNHLKIILTGATGMVGEGVLHECLSDRKVAEVLVLGRRSCGVQHPKLTEVIHDNFFDLSPVQTQLAGYNSCLFCLGVSSIGMKEPEFTRLTYTLTMHVAQTLCSVNNNMVFCYISGAATDSTEKGKAMWARVKGKTENDLMKLSLKAVYNFRPAALQPTKGLKNTLKYYKYINWLLPIVKAIAPKYVCSLQELGKAMINSCAFGYSKNILEVTDIVELAEKHQ